LNKITLSKVKQNKKKTLLQQLAINKKIKLSIKLIKNINLKNLFQHYHKYKLKIQQNNKKEKKVIQKISKLVK